MTGTLPSNKNLATDLQYCRFPDPNKRNGAFVLQRIDSLDLARVVRREICKKPVILITKSAYLNPHSSLHTNPSTQAIRVLLFGICLLVCR